MFHSIQFHFISKCSFTGEETFSLQIAVNHNNCGCIIVQITDNYRHGLFFCQFTCSVPSVSGHQFITALRVRSSNRRNQNAILLDTVCGLHHGFVILDFEWMPFERVQFRQRDFYYFFSLSIGTALLRRKQIIYRCQFYFFRAAFQVSTPPSSDFDTPLPPYRQGHGRKCFFPLR